MTFLYPQQCVVQPEHCKLSACSQTACMSVFDDSDTHWVVYVTTNMKSDHVSPEQGM